MDAHVVYLVNPHAADVEWRDSVFTSRMHVAWREFEAKI